MYHGLRGARADRARPPRCSPRCASPRPRRGCAPSRTSSRAACASAWWAPWPSRRRRGCSSPTSRPPASTSPSRPSISACLKELQERHRLAMIFVTHNLGIVAQHLRPGGGDVRGPHRRDRARCGASSPRPRIPTRRPCSSRSRASAPGTDAPHRHRGPAAGPRDAAGGLRVRAALPARDGPLPRRRRRPSSPSAPGTRPLLAQRPVERVTP